MKSKGFVVVISVIVAVVVLTGACSAGFAVGWLVAPGAKSIESADPSGNTPFASSQPANLSDLFVPFWEAWDIVHEYYIDQPVDNEKLMQGAIKGMMDSLGDQHTSYMDPVQYKDATADLSGEYEGIGSYVSTDGVYLTITEPMKGSPAEKAGLQPGDQIIAIDGADMTGIFPEVARQKVLGPANTTVVLTILREGLEEPFDVSVTRASIKVASVEGEMLENGLAYIKLRNFGEKTGDELRTELRRLLKEKPTGLILDLRNNTGGALSTCIQVASEFIEDGVILYEEYGDGTRDTHKAIGGGLATDIPMVVLVNEYSASASEVLAGALQDYERATLVGGQTYGKGSVQQWLGLSNDEGAVRVTVARWLTPEERHIHEVGLEPDMIVELTEEDVKADLDPQLDKAIELLTTK